MADHQFDPYAQRKRVIRQRNIALGLALAFFAVLFFAITVVKMRHVKMPHRRPSPALAPALAPVTGGNHGS